MQPLPSLTTPWAIVLGAGLVALAVYFRPPGPRQESVGLAPREAAGPPPGSEQRGSEQRAEQVGRATTGGSSSSTAAELEQLARQALLDARPRLVAACWKPADVPAPEEASVEFDVGVTFSKSGKQIAWVVSDLHRGERAGAVGQCLRRLPMELEIEPPGRVVHIQHRLKLP